CRLSAVSCASSLASGRPPIPLVIWDLGSGICNLQLAICNLQFATCNLQLAICYLLFGIRSSRSATRFLLFPLHAWAGGASGNRRSGARRGRLGDHDQRIWVIRPLFSIGHAGLESLVDPPFEVRDAVCHPRSAQPLLITVEMFGHDLAVIHPDEQV